MLLRPSFLAATALTAASIACVPSMPGTTLGTYEVTAEAQTNTCGLSAPDPWTFDVQLSEDQGLLYWNWMDGSSLVSGALASSGAAILTQSVEDNVDGTDAGPGPCTMVRDDSYAVQLASGSPPGGFTGTITYDIAAAPGASCADQLTASGGQYEALPCTMVYSVTATRN